MMRKRIMITALITALAAQGCSTFVKPPKDALKGRDVILMLVDSSDFKDSLVQGIADYAAKADYRTELDTTKRAKFFHAADYAAVIYMAEYWAWHVPWNAKRYYRNNDEADNIMFIITAGDPDVTITKPFDAVTTASRPEQRDAVLSDVFGRLDRILGEVTPDMHRPGANSGDFSD